MRREQQQVNEEARRHEEEATGVKPPAPAGESQELREGVRQLQDQQAQFAEAARVMRQKGIISRTPEQAAAELKLKKQKPGE